MLEFLEIENYRLFKSLKIPELSQINLISGKNNTGKSILLEAIRIYASHGDVSVINNIIDSRGDWKNGSRTETYASLYPFMKKLPPIVK